MQGQRPLVGEADAPVAPRIGLGRDHRREDVAQGCQVVVGGEAGELEQLARQHGLAVDEILDRPGGKAFRSGGARRDHIARHAATPDRHAHASSGLDALLLIRRQVVGEGLPHRQRQSDVHERGRRRRRGLGWLRWLQGRCWLRWLR